MTKEKKFFHLHMLSDATGETLISVGRAVASQYAMIQATEHIYPMIRNRIQLQKALDEIQQEPGIVLYTMIDEELKLLLQKKMQKNRSSLY